MLRNRKLQAALVVLAFAAATGLALTGAPAEAARPAGPPGPLCGWTALWNCDMPHGPDRQISGTQCDIAEFERRTGATCEPAGG